MRSTAVVVMLAAVASCAGENAPTHAGDDGTARVELDRLRAAFPLAPLVASTERATHPARVALPDRADGDVVLDDVGSSVGVRFHLVGALAAPRVDTDGVSLFVAAHLVDRIVDAGVEDYVAFDTHPTSEEIRYDVDVSRVPGLRLVANTLEMLDAAGTPRLRVAAPFLLDATGAARPATLTLEGCAFDASGAAPWGRPITSPGASRCTVRIVWSGVSYPALLDPSWMTTGGSNARDQHTTVKLSSGKVLVVYGNVCSGGCFLAPGASLYDPTSGTFATTGGPPDRFTGAPGIALSNGMALILSSGPLLYDPVAGAFTSTGTLGCGDCSVTTLPSGLVLLVDQVATLYDPTANTFTTAATPLAARSLPAAALLASGKVLISGGSGLASAEIYDPVASTFTQTGNMTEVRAGHFAFTLANGKVLVVGGASDPTAELYDPVAGTFTATGSMTVTRTNFGATLLDSGKVIVVGGFINTNATPSTERYDPASGTFVPAPNLVAPRGYNGVVLLDDGTVLTTFGRTIDTGFGTSLGSAEVLPVVAAGGVCTANDDCQLGDCDVSGVCCAASCTASCHTCAATTGACTVVEGADDPDTCTGAMTCDATGTCKAKAGQACTSSATCASGFCADGYCCNSACTGTCEACDGLARGTCGPIAGPPHGARACAGAGGATTCSGACDGTMIDACIYPSTTTGCGTACTSGVRTARACDGMGSCVDQPARSCPGNFACADAETCKTTCAGDGDCATGYTCKAGACAPAVTCDGDHTVTSADGVSTTDCAPFKCDPTMNVCITSCMTEEQCVTPDVCNATGQCVAPPTEAPASSGCGVGSGSGRGGEGEGGGAGMVVVVAWGIGWRRRRRG